MSKFIKTGVIGHPISHSKSPIIHKYWMSVHSREGSYETIDITPENLKEGVQRLIDEGYAGLNVTVPHKRAIMDLCHEIDDLAQKVGAVNMVSIRNGLLYGSNTDVFGFAENLKKASQDFGFSWVCENGPAIVLGAGGAARAVIHGLIKENAPEIIIANRTPETARELVAIDPAIIRVIPWEERSKHLSQANLLVNTTSVGMNDEGDLDMDFSEANEDLLVHDIVYTPLYTKLLKEAREHDLRVLTGIGMLLYQAQPAFEEWHDVFVEVNEQLQNRVLES
ncbi:MAG: shikimate dehydrogenase [Alphaproteobacteria bacterium]